MARKCKVGIEYFSHDVDMAQDKKIKIIKAKHGFIGYALFLRLLEEIYREEGYFLKIDDDFNILFSDENNLDYNVYILMLNDYINKGLFDKEMYDKYSILTSKRIQQNYIAATDRRKEVEFIEEYTLLDVCSMYSEKVNVIINRLNVDINPLNDYKSTQSKVNKKESKVEENNIVISVIQYLNEKANTNYKPTTDKTIKLINARVKEGYNLEDFKTVIDIKTKEWLNTDMRKYLRPETIFGNKFESYLNQKIIENNIVKDTPKEKRLGVPEYDGVLGERGDDDWI